MWGYGYVAAMLDAVQPFSDRWLIFPLSVAATYGVFIGAGYCIAAFANKLSEITFREKTKNRPTILLVLQLILEVPGFLIIGWAFLCATVWIFYQIPPPFGTPGSFVATAIGAYILFGVVMVWVEEHQRTKSAPDERLNTSSGPSCGFAAAALIGGLLIFALWYFFQREVGNFLSWVAAFLIAGSPVAAYWLWRKFYPRSPVEATSQRSQSRSSGTWPPLGRPEVTTHGDAQLADPSRHAHSMRDILGGPRAIWFGQFSNSDREASYGGDRHLLTVAPNRTGKGTCTIIPNLLMDLDHSIICIDPKGQNAAVTARSRRRDGKPVYCLNPFGEHASAPWNLPMHGFNPLAGMDIDDPNVEADVAALAEAIIVTESTTNPYFDNSARDLIEVLILHALATKGKSATLLDMRAWLGQPMQAPDGEPSLLNTIVIMTQSRYSFIKEMAARFLSDTKSVNEIVQSATNQTKFLSHRAIATCLSGNDFQMIDFKEKKATLYVILPERYLDAYSRFLRLVVVSSLNALRSRPGGVKTIIMMDEFARLGALGAVEQAVGSSAGFNVQLWPFIQDLNQLQHLYPKRWKSFIANAGVVQWFTPNDSTTADFLSARVGKTTVLNTTINRTKSLGRTSGGSGPGLSAGETTSSNENELAMDFLSAQDLYSMPDHFQLLTLAGLSYPICAFREKYYAAEGALGDVFKQLADPDPFHQ
jgi:type IV secretion system protein VirD4